MPLTSLFFLCAPRNLVVDVHPCKWFWLASCPGLAYHTWIRTRGKDFRPQYDTSLGHIFFCRKVNMFYLTYLPHLSASRGDSTGSHLQDPVDDDVH